MHQIQGTYKIVSNDKMSERFMHMKINAPQLAKAVKPGQFIHLRVTLGLEPFFRRPFSVFRAKRNIEIFYEVIGCGTKKMAEKKKGDDIDVLGPLGTSFSMPPKGIKQVVMIAGGIGVAPFLAFSDILKRRKCELILLYGGRTKGHTFSMKEYKSNGCKVYVSTDDGSVGVKGRVSKFFSKIDLNPETTFLYTCGPAPMMAAVQEFAKKNNLQGEASLEEVMACGLGACLGCSTKTKEGYKTVCYDGPVFDLQTVDFSKH